MKRKISLWFRKLLLWLLGGDMLRDITTQSCGPISRDDYEMLNLLGYPWITPEWAIAQTINYLITVLYRPTYGKDGKPDLIPVDAELVKELENRYGDFGMVNWGDLSCIHVRSTGFGGYIALVEEARPNPDGSSGLANYLKDWLRALGWENVDIVLEW